MKNPRIQFLISPIILLLIIGVYPFRSSAQDCRKLIISTTNDYTLFAVPYETDMSSITPMDLSLALTEEEKTTTEICIDNSNEISVTTLFYTPPQYEHDYQHMVGRSVVNSFETKLFDHQGNLLHQENNITGIPMIIEEHEVLDYGLFSGFNDPLDQMLVEFESLGYTTMIDSNGTFIASNDTMEFYFGPNTLSIETRFFDEAGNHTYTNWQKFKDMEGVLLPAYEVEIDYKTLFSGTKMQRKKIKEYLAYYVEQDGISIVDYNKNNPGSPRIGELEFTRYDEIEQKNPHIKIYPNPSSDEIAVEVPDYISEYIDLKIVNTNGAIVKQLASVKTGATVIVKINDLSPGVYMVQCGRNTKWKSAKLIVR